MRHLIIIILLFCFLSPNYAQNKDPQAEFGNWNAWINSLVFSPNWKLDTDFHLRTWQLGKDPNTLILRGGLTYVAKPWLEFLAGYGYFEFYPYAGEDGWKANSKEHRPYQQIFAKHKVKGFSFNHRLRLEERLIQTPAEKQILRSRYRFFVSHPVVSKLYAWTSYEHFWTMSDWKFDQGRLHLGFGHPIAKNAKLELAYLHHFVKNKVEYKRLQINLITSFSLKQAEENLRK